MLQKKQLWIFFKSFKNLVEFKARVFRGNFIPTREQWLCRAHVNVSPTNLPATPIRSFGKFPFHQHRLQILSSVQEFLLCAGLTGIWFDSEWLPYWYPIRVGLFGIIIPTPPPPPFPSNLSSVFPMMESKSGKQNLLSHSEYLNRHCIERFPSFFAQKWRPITYHSTQIEPNQMLRGLDT